MSNTKLYTTDGKVRHFSTEEEINARLEKIIGDKFTQYRRRWDEVNRLETVTEFPLFLQVDMNQFCNLKCPHCIVGNPKEIHNYYSREPLKWEDYCKIVLEGEEHGCPSIAPQGNNEPLLKKDLEKYIEFAHQHGFIDIMMNTNATLLTKERSRRLLDSGLTRLRFSIDAVSAKTFEKIRIGGNYDQVIRNIETFLELKHAGNYQLPVVGVSFCRMSLNEHEEDEFFERWIGKVDLVTIQTFIPPILEKDFSMFYPRRQFPSEIGSFDFKCPQPYQRVTIRNYDITPCCAMFSSKLAIGNLKKDTIHDAWHSDAMNRLREIHRNGEYFNNDICRQCVNMTFPTAGDVG